jgi:hypothetical protein
VGFTIRFPDFAVLVSLVCWGCTPSVVVFCGICQVVIPQVFYAGKGSLIGFCELFSFKKVVPYPDGRANGQETCYGWPFPTSFTYLSLLVSNISLHGFW